MVTKRCTDFRWYLWDVGRWVQVKRKVCEQLRGVAVSNEKARMRGWH